MGGEWQWVFAIHLSIIDYFVKLCQIHHGGFVRSCSQTWSWLRIKFQILVAIAVPGLKRIGCVRIRGLHETHHFNIAVKKSLRLAQSGKIRQYPA